MKHLSCIATIVLLFPLARPTSAQATRPDGGELESRTRVLSVTPGIRIIDVGLDTNVFNEAGRRDPDYTATVVPRLDVEIETSRFDLRVSGTTGLVYYQKYASERAVNPRAELELERRFGPHLAFYGEGAYGYSKERSGFEVDARIRRLARNGLAGSRITGRRMRFDVRASRAQIEHEHEPAPFAGADPAFSLDRTTTAASAELGFRVTRYTWVVFGGDSGSDRFPRSPKRDANSTRAFAGIQLKPRAAIAGDVRVGYRRAEMLDNTSPDFSGMTARGGISFTWRDMLALSAGAERDLDYSFQADRPYFVYDLYEAAIRQAVGRRFDVGGSVSHTTLTHRFFDPAPVTASAEARTRAQIRGATVSLGLRLTRRSRVGIYVARWERLGERPYQTTRTGVQVTLGRANVSERGVFVLGPGR